MTQEEFVEYLSEITDRLSAAVDGESEADVVCAAAVLIIGILEAPDAPPRLPVMDRMLPLLQQMVGSFAAYKVAGLDLAELPH